jgi:hypothetical protein
LPGLTRNLPWANPTAYRTLIFSLSVRCYRAEEAPNVQR